MLQNTILHAVVNRYSISKDQTQVFFFVQTLNNVIFVIELRTN